jgi:hypothetical protein
LFAPDATLLEVGAQHFLDLLDANVGLLRLAAVPRGLNMRTDRIELFLQDTPRLAWHKGERPFLLPANLKLL